MGEYFEQELRANQGIDGVFPGMLEKDLGLVYNLKCVGIYAQYKNGNKTQDDPDRYIPFPLSKMGDCDKWDKDVKKKWEAPGKKPHNWPAAGVEDLVEA